MLVCCLYTIKYFLKTVFISYRYVYLWLIHRRDTLYRPLLYDNRKVQTSEDHWQTTLSTQTSSPLSLHVQDSYSLWIVARHAVTSPYTVYHVYEDLRTSNHCVNCWIDTICKWSPTQLSMYRYYHGYDASLLSRSDEVTVIFDYPPGAMQWVYVMLLHEHHLGDSKIKYYYTGLVILHNRCLITWRFTWMYIGLICCCFRLSRDEAIVLY
jgi:hypothetical protein